MIGRIGQANTDNLARADPQITHVRCGTPDQPIEFAVGQPPRTVDDRWMVRPAASVIGQSIRDRHDPTFALRPFE
jgi:hypothetical protein